jgi:hypothetical protein
MDTNELNVYTGNEIVIARSFEKLEGKYYSIVAMVSDSDWELTVLPDAPLPS